MGCHEISKRNHRKKFCWEAQVCWMFIFIFIDFYDVFPPVIMWSINKIYTKHLTTNPPYRGKFSVLQQMLLHSPLSDTKNSCFSDVYFHELKRDSKWNADAWNLCANTPFVYQTKMRVFTIFLYKWGPWKLRGSKTVCLCIENKQCRHETFQMKVICTTLRDHFLG